MWFRRCRQCPMWFEGHTMGLMPKAAAIRLPTTRQAFSGLIIIFGVLLTPVVWAKQGQAVTVFAAASLSDALQSVLEAYRADSPNTASRSMFRLSFAASSTLARQIEAGAPANIYCSASIEWMDYLEQRRLIDSATRMTVLSNRLVLIAPRSPARKDTGQPNRLTQHTPISVHDALSRLASNERLAIGDPAHVPAGRYARMALERLGLWQTLAPRLARTENVRAALALVARAEAPLGIVYASDARISDRVQVVAEFAKTPIDSPQAIMYSFAMTSGHDTPEARALFAFLTGPNAAKVFARFGFVTR